MLQRFPGTMTSVHVSTRLLPSSARHVNPSVHSASVVSYISPTIELSAGTLSILESWLFRPEVTL